MNAPSVDLRLALAVDLQIATACLHDAATRVTELLRTRPTPITAEWERQYAGVYRYLLKSQQVCQTKVQALEPRTHEAVAPISMEANGATKDLDRALAHGREQRDRAAFLV